MSHQSHFLPDTQPNLPNAHFFCLTQFSVWCARKLPFTVWAVEFNMHLLCFARSIVTFKFHHGFWSRSPFTLQTTTFFFWQEMFRENTIPSAWAGFHVHQAKNKQHFCVKHNWKTQTQVIFTCVARPLEWNSQKKIGGLLLILSPRQQMMTITALLIMTQIYICGRGCTCREGLFLSLRLFDSQ